jgi:hypothetical protein
MVGTGWLENWRLTFAGEELVGWEGAVTTIVESPGDRVFVALYDVHAWDEARLDEVEGVDSGAYTKLHLRVATLDPPGIKCPIPIVDPIVVVPLQTRLS